MSLFSGKTALSRLYVKEFVDTTDAKMRQFLKPRCIKPLLLDDPCESECGWSTLQGNPDLEAQSLFTGDYFVFGFRVDTKKIDNGALRKAVREEIAKYAEERGLKKVHKTVREQIKESVRSDMVKAAYPSARVFQVVVDTKTGMLYTDTPSGLLLDILVTRLGECEVEPVMYMSSFSLEPLLNAKRIKDLGLTAVEQPWRNTSSEFFRMCAHLVLKDQLSVGTYRLDIGDKVSFAADGQTGLKMCTLRAKDGMAFLPEFTLGLRKRHTMESITLSSAFGEQTWSVQLDGKMRMRLSLPNPEVAEFDDMIAKRMEYIEAVCDVVDTLYMEYYNSYVGKVDQMSADM